MNDNLYIIRKAQWFVAIGLTAFAVSIYFQKPEIWVLLASPLVGFFISLLLPFAWRRNNNWIWWVVGFFPLILVVQIFHVSGVQFVFLSIAIASLTWVCFRAKFIDYITNGT